MASNLSERELKRIERERRIEEDRVQMDKDKRRKKKESEHKLLKEHERELKLIELQKQREQLLEERRIYKERRQLMIDMNKNRKEREMLEKEMKNVSLNESMVYGDDNSDTGEEYNEQVVNALIPTENFSDENENEISSDRNNEMNITGTKKDEANYSERYTEDKDERHSELVHDEDLYDESEKSDIESIENIEIVPEIHQDYRHTETLRKKETYPYIDSADSEGSDDFKTVDQTYDTDILRNPEYNSSEIEDNVPEDKQLEDEMKWLDEKWRKYESENTQLETEIKQIQNTNRMSSDTIRNRPDRNRSEEMRKKRNTKNVKLGHDNEQSDEERKVIEKIKQLKIREKKVNDVIEKNRLLKKRQADEVEKMNQRKLEMKRQREKKRVKEAHIKKLKEEERKLKERIKAKETTLLREEKDYKNDSENKDTERKSDKSVKQDSWKGKLHKPNIPSLTETTFEEWKIEVEIILKSELYEEHILRQAVRNSFCGQTRKTLLTMSSDATTREIIDKLDSIFGYIRSGESVLSEFYKSRQKRGETISEWALRLEGNLQKAIEKGHVKEDQRDEMLKVRFWRHLYNEDLKNATRLSFETAKSFEELRRKVRIEENEMVTARESEIEITDKVTLNQHIEEDDQSVVMKMILERMKSLEDQLLRLQEKDKVDSAKPEQDEDRYLDRKQRMSRYDNQGRERDRYDRYDRWNRRNYTDKYRDYENRKRGYERDYKTRYNRQDRNREDPNRYGRKFYGRDRNFTDQRDRSRDTSDRYERRDYIDRNNRREERYGFDRERGYSDPIDTRVKDTDRDGYTKRGERDINSVENRQEMRKEENDKSRTPKQQETKKPLKQQQLKPDTTNKENFARNLNR